MATASSSPRDTWNEGVTRVTKAARRHLTATNLAAAGAVTLGAAAFAYFRKPERRNAFLASTRRLAGKGRFWKGLGSPSINQ